MSQTLVAAAIPTAIGIRKDKGVIFKKIPFAANGILPSKPVINAKQTFFFSNLCFFCVLYIEAKQRTKKSKRITQKKESNFFFRWEKSTKK